MLTEIVAYLVIHGQGTEGVDLFMGLLPVEPTRAAALYEYGGLPPRIAFDQTQWEQPRVQVLVRDAVYERARERAEAIYQTFIGMTNVLVGATFYLSASPTPPALFERDANGRTVFAIDVLFQKALSVVP